MAHHAPGRLERMNHAKRAIMLELAILSRPSAAIEAAGRTLLTQSALTPHTNRPAARLLTNGSLQRTSGATLSNVDTHGISGPDTAARTVPIR
ncbi:hypothetical protein D9M68_103430 [compost metagenome]